MHVLVRMSGYILMSRVHVEVRGKFPGNGPLPPACFWGSKPGYQAWQQCFAAIELSYHSQKVCKCIYILNILQKYELDMH